LPDPAPPPAEEPLRSVHTASFPQLLGELGCSLLITTYQAGKLIVARNDGGVLGLAAVDTSEGPAETGPDCTTSGTKRRWGRQKSSRLRNAPVSASLT
jgi:hypothetical protein